MKQEDKISLAILGATGHIARGLIFELLRRGHRDLYLYTRSIERCERFIKINNLATPKKIGGYDEFGTDKYDAVINCTGIGSPRRLAREMASILRITEEFDDLVIGYLNDDNDALYINLSSGAVYGGSFDRPVDKDTNVIVDASSLYGIAKLKAEARHRSLKHLNIVDLRLFSYFSRFIDLDDNYFMCDVVSSIKQHINLITSPSNVVRDYITPSDLLLLMECCIKERRINDDFDVYSKEPVDKFSILEHFSKRYGLKYKIIQDNIDSSITGFKKYYYSLNKKAQNIGYAPKATSIDGLIDQAAHILTGNEL